VRRAAIEEKLDDRKIRAALATVGITSYFRSLPPDDHPLDLSTFHGSRRPADLEAPERDGLALGQARPHERPRHRVRRRRHPGAGDAGDGQ
jgi:hypothetical protein